MSATLHRREVMRELLKGRRPDLLVVAGLGSTAWDLAACSDSPLDFPLWGSMGAAAMIGLGLALAQPEKPVVVFTGDGEQLMGLGGLAAIAVQRPSNLSIVVMDNELYGETGRQKTHTAHGVKLDQVALACGFPRAILVQQMNEVSALREVLYAGQGPLLAAIKVALTPDPMTLPPRDGPYLKNRFRKALLGEGAVME